MMKSKKELMYSGLKEDICCIAKIIYIYESLISKFNSLKEFEKKFKNSAKLFNRTQFMMEYNTLDKLNNKNKINKKKATLLFSKSKFQVYDFLRHFRNSFSHSNLRKDDEKLYISDYNSKHAITCSGFIDYIICIKNIVNYYRRIRKK